MTAWPFDGLEPHSFGTVSVDPPWPSPIEARLGGKGRRTRSRAADHYSTMTLDDIAALPVTDLLDGAGHVWLWATNRVMARGDHKAILDAWELRPVTVVTWCKPGANGLGRYLRNSTEHAILAIAGWGHVPDTPAPSTWFQSARGAHSAKPAAFGDLVEHVSPGPYAELFQRHGRIGWSGWGLGHELTRQEPA